MGCPLSKQELDILDRPLSDWELDEAATMRPGRAPEWLQQIQSVEAMNNQPKEQAKPRPRAERTKEQFKEHRRKMAESAKLELLAWLSMNPDKTRTEIADALLRSRAGVFNHLKALQSDQLVDCWADKNALRWRVTCN